MLVTHSKSITIADGTNTDIVRPSNWNDSHVGKIVIGGNTAGVSSWSGSQMQFNGGSLVTLSINGNTLNINGADIVSDYACPVLLGGATSSQTMGAMGVTSASAYFFPVILSRQVNFNLVRVPVNASWISSSASYTQQLTFGLGLYSNNAGTLSVISRTSFGFTVSGSSISGTITFPASTSLTGYATTSTNWAVTATGQQLIGNVGIRMLDACFGASLSLSPGTYWVGAHVKMATAGGAGGLQLGLHGINVPVLQSAALIGISTANVTASTILRKPLFGLGIATSTASANFGGTTVPQDYPLANINMGGMVVLPFCTLHST